MKGEVVGKYQGNEERDNGWFLRNEELKRNQISVLHEARHVDDVAASHGNLNHAAIIYCRRTKQSKQNGVAEQEKCECTVELSWLQIPRCLRCVPWQMPNMRMTISKFYAHHVAVNTGA